jgi:phenylacetate-CoA ligase
MSDPTPLVTASPSAPQSSNAPELPAISDIHDQKPLPQGRGSAGGNEWPERLDAHLAALLVDARWIAHLDRQPLESVQAWQTQRVAQLLTHATRHSPWWRQRLTGLGRRITLADVPVTGREDYRASIETVGGPLPLPPEHGSPVHEATSGSTGVAVEFYSSSLAKRLVDAEWHHDDVRQGRRSAALRAELSGRVPEHAGEHTRARIHPLLGGGEVLKRRLHQFSIEAHADWLSRVGVPYFSTLPVALSGILDVYEGGTVAPPRIEQVLTFGETVDPALRRRTRAMLGATIRDRYSCEEVGAIAFQCPHSDENYHIASSNVVVEILDDGGHSCPPDTIGRIVVTGLHNYASPVVRYELNDLAAWQPRCACGRAEPVLTQLLGRKRFLVRLPSGGRIAVRLGAKEWLDIAPVREHRLVQVSERVIHVELVLERPLTEAERTAVVALLSREISPDLTYEVRQVERIEWGPTYKRQDLVSLV